MAVPVPIEPGPFVVPGAAGLALPRSDPRGAPP